MEREIRQKFRTLQTYKELVRQGKAIRGHRVRSVLESTYFFTKVTRFNHISGAASEHFCKLNVIDL